MRYSAETTASSTEIIDRARVAFGQRGLGLRLDQIGMMDARFTSDVGFVSLSIERADGQNTVIIETREFDNEVMQFLRQLPRRSWMSQFTGRLRSKR